MNLNQLRFASTVASCGSFSRAAEACHVTQPTLSNGVAQLEKQLGAKLFERTTRRVALTSFGRHMVPMIDQVLSAVDDLDRSADAFLKPAAKISRIGLSPLIDTGRLTRILEPFRRTHPDVEIFFKQCFMNDLFHRLQSEKIDVALWPLPVEVQTSQYLSVPLYKEPLMFVPGTETMPKTTPSGFATVPSIANETFVLTPDLCGLVRATRQIFDSAGVPLIEYPGQALSYEVMQEWATLGIGSAILPMSKLQDDHLEDALPLGTAKDRPLRLELVASWKRSTATLPHNQALQQHIQNVVPKLIAGDADTEPGQTQPSSRTMQY